MEADWDRVGRRNILAFRILEFNLDWYLGPEGQPLHCCLLFWNIHLSPLQHFHALGTPGFQVWSYLPLLWSDIFSLLLLATSTLAEIKPGAWPAVSYSSFSLGSCSQLLSALHSATLLNFLNLPWFPDASLVGKFQQNTVRWSERPPGASLVSHPFAFITPCPWARCWLSWWLTILLCDMKGCHSVQFSHSIVSDSLVPQGLLHTRLPVHHQLKLMSIESVMPSNHLILWRSIFLPPSIFPSIRVFSNKSVLHIRWPKYWSFSFSINTSNEYSGLISLE